MERFLGILFRHRLLFHFGYLRDIRCRGFQSYSAIPLFIAKDDLPLQNILFLWERGLIPYINIDGFHLGLIEALHAIGAMTYHITKDDYSAILTIFGVDTTGRCGPSTNVGFVHFIWTHLEQFSPKKILFDDRSLTQ
jgi:hypothetical protein